MDTCAARSQWVGWGGYPGGKVIDADKSGAHLRNGVDRADAAKPLKEEGVPESDGEEVDPDGIVSEGSGSFVEVADGAGGKGKGTKKGSGDGRCK